MKWKIILAVCGTVGSGLFATAATITVTTTDPTVAVDGQCALPEAIVNANTDAATHIDCVAGSGADVVVLASAASYVLDQVNTNYDGPNGLPLVTSEITVEGNGSTIERSTDGPEFRLLAVVGVLEMRDLTLRNGDVGSFGGGAVLSRGTVRLVRTTVTENAAQAGGGLFNLSGMMTVSDSEIRLNVAVGGGGGITSGAETADATLVIDGTSVSDNAVLDGGGGAVWAYAEGAFTSDLRVVGSAITGNTAGHTTGGIRSVMADVHIEDSAIDGNHADWACGGLFLEGGSGDITRTTISNNIVENTIDFGNGGGLCVTDNTTTITNSTISGNQVLGPSVSNPLSGRGGGISILGGALNDSPFVDTVTVIEDSTICDNTAETFGGGVSVYRNAGNMAVELELRNTVVAENLEGGAAVLGNCVAEAPTVITSSDYNLADDVTCSLVDTNDLVVADVMLSALGDHGGPTLTHVLMAGSPAIDSGDDAMCPGTDQRGAPRPLDGDGDGDLHCDRGAVESGVMFMDGFESGDTSRWSSTVP